MSNTKIQTGHSLPVLHFYHNKPNNKRREMFVGKLSQKTALIPIQSFICAQGQASGGFVNQ